MTSRHRHRTRGYTLHELMIVIGIISILLARSIPSLVHARASGNETAAFGRARSCHADEQAYFRKNATYGTLAQLTAANLGQSGSRAGYYFDVRTNATGTQWVAVAWPMFYGTTGSRTFVIDQRGVIVCATTQVITGSDASTWVSSSPYFTTWNTASLTGWQVLGGK